MPATTAPASAQAHAGWTVLAPIKRLDGAKTRLSTRPAGLRRGLALAFAVDTVDAALTVPEVVRVLAVTDDDAVREAMESLGAGWIADAPDLGLNGGIADAAARLRREEPGLALAVLVADLPALRGEELSRALRAAAAVPRGFVADAAGTGTTLLTALPGVGLDPRFGPRSRAAHAASGAVALEPGPVPGLRRDVDTEVDLWDAGRLGVGRATADALALDGSA